MLDNLCQYTVYLSLYMYAHINLQVQVSHKSSIILAISLQTALYMVTNTCDTWHIVRQKLPILCSSASQIKIYYLSAVSANLLALSSNASILALAYLVCPNHHLIAQIAKICGIYKWYHAWGHSWPHACRCNDDRKCIQKSSIDYQVEIMGWK